MIDINHLTEKVIGASYKVHNSLGVGFLESVYEKSLMIELRKLGLEVENQYPLKVYYEGHVVGEFIADLFVENKLIVELKAVNNLAKVHEVQLVNYLSASKLDNGLLLNFTSKVEVKRKYRIWSNTVSQN